MTLPALVNKIQYKELKTALNKNYTVLQQALTLAQIDTGEIVKPSNYQNLNVSDDTRFPFMYLIKKYVKNSKDCGVANCFRNTGETPNDYYRTFNNKNAINAYIMDAGQFITTDGSFFMIENSMGAASLPIYITVDVNGLNKKPNRWGYDLFTFQLMESGKLLPMGAEGTDLSAEEYCSATSTSKNNGAGCTYPALTDNSYWKNLR